jgi:hypothetical protein
MRSAWLCLVCVLAACGSAADDWKTPSGAPQLMVVNDVWAFSETDVWFLDGSSTVQRFDGQSWSTLATPSMGGLGCIYAVSATEVWLCAGDELLHWDGTAFDEQIDIATLTGVNSLIGAWASSPSDIWLLGDDANVAHWDGVSWSASNNGASLSSSIWGSGPTDVYVLGTFDFVHNDGSGWSSVDLGPGGGGGDGQVWGTSASDVWVMTGSSNLHHFDGQAWETIETDFVGDPQAVWGPAPDDLWAVGSAGSIAHYDGSSWEEVTHQSIGAPYLRMLLAVHGTSTNDVWAVGNQLGEGGSTGIIWHYHP